MAGPRARAGSRRGRAEKEGRGRALAGLQAEAGRLRALGCDASAEIALGTPDERLVELARERKAELVVVAATQWQFGSTAERVAQAELLLVGRHARGALARLWRGSVSEGVLHHATLSVCCVPYSEGEEEGLPELRRILVPVDLSSASGRAVRAACGLARPGTEVILFHVTGGPPGRAAAEGRDREVAELRAKVRALVPAEAERRGIPVQVEIAEAPQVGRAILQAAERVGADLVCVGGRGRSALAKALLGSAVEEILRGCARPVMVVPPPPEE